jgi:hypothetical protein
MFINRRKRPPLSILGAMCDGGMAAMVVVMFDKLKVK